MIVLNYHQITAGTPRDAWCLTEEQFRAHADVFKPGLIAPHTFFANCQKPESRNSQDVLLTFDDGCLSDYSVVFPRFAGKRGPGFVSFLVTDFVGKPDHLTWKMAEEMARGGVTIGSHGVSHADMTSLSPAELVAEMTGSRQMLEDRLGKEIRHFAFPYGRFNRAAWEAALAAGYTHLFTIQLGHHNGFESFLYSRLCVTNSMSAKYLAGHIANPCQDRGMAWRIATGLGLYRPLMQWRYR